MSAVVEISCRRQIAVAKELRVTACRCAGGGRRRRGQREGYIKERERNISNKGE
jgi:hypothetical protein